MKNISPESQLMQSTRLSILSWSNNIFLLKPVSKEEHLQSPLSSLILSHSIFPWYLKGKWQSSVRCSFMHWKLGPMLGIFSTPLSLRIFLDFGQIPDVMFTLIFLFFFKSATENIVHVWLALSCWKLKTVKSSFSEQADAQPSGVEAVDDVLLVPVTKDTL